MEGLKKLQDIGSSVIANTTHIPLQHVENILEKNLQTFQKPQLFGFLSILEREYKVDLSGLRQDFLFDLAEAKMAQEPSFDIAERSTEIYERRREIFKDKRFLGAIVAIIGLSLILVFVSMMDFSVAKEEKIEINNTAIDQAKKNLHLTTPQVEDVEVEMNKSDVESAEFGQEEASKSVEKADVDAKPVSSSEPVMPLYLRIVPKGRLWLGIINTETHRRRVETISKPLELDPKKSWLIITGYGHLNVECGDITNKYREDRKLLILYEAGVCQIIDKAEFKARNRGKLW